MTKNNPKRTSRRTKNASAYAQAGVDIDGMMSAISAVKRMVKKTATPGVLGNIGSFGGLFAMREKGNVLVASTDGVGTKLKVAVLANRHNTVGQDLVNHCVNDILAQGARPLFFMDYLGTAKLSGRVFREVVSGLCKACRQNGCALLGGETAEMPGLYPEGEYDLVGTIVGAVERKRLITGKTIRPGDRLIGLPSNGLHTNGYSLARKALLENAGLSVHDPFPGTQKSVATTLLATHRSYLRPVGKVMEQVIVRGMAHITGGGLVDNVPRSLPRSTTAVIDRRAWKTPRVFEYLQEAGGVSRDEMYRVFNMGIGFVIIVRDKDAKKTAAILKQMKERPILLGHVKEGGEGVLFED